MALGTTVQNSDGPVPMDVDCIWKGKGKDKGKNDRVKGDGKGWKGKGKNDKGARIRKVLGMQMVAGVKANIRCQTSLEKRPRRGKANLERARMDVGNVARLATWPKSVVCVLWRKQVTRIVKIKQLDQQQRRQTQLQQTTVAE